MASPDKTTRDAEKLIAWLREAADELEKAHLVLDDEGIGRALPGSEVECTLAARIALLAHQADALLILEFPWLSEAYDAIHASPPCQAFTAYKRTGNVGEYPDLVAQTRDLLDMLTEQRNEARRMVVRLQQERDDYLRVVQAARLALDFLPATGQVSLPHRRGLEVVRAELRNALAALVASPDKPPEPQ